VCRREGDSQLVVMSPGGSDERVVVREGSSDSPSWANDSRHIAFSSRRGGARAIYVVDLYSGLERRLTSGHQEAVTPAWSSE
jgi:Tol biopolymer transport system component